MQAKTPEEKHKIAAQWLPEGITSAELLSKEFPPMVWVVPDLIPEGLTLLVGAPKIGKSWLALNLAIALSCGGRALGQIKVEKTTVLFLALEDSQRRLRRRFDQLGDNGLRSPDLHIYTEWPRGKAGIDEVYVWQAAHEECGLIIIDTLQQFRGPSPRGQSYEVDVEEVSQIKSMADHLETPIIALHHSRKLDSPDYVERISGTFGVSGTADTNLFLAGSRRSRDATLDACGRDIEDLSLALKKNIPGIGWEILGDADEYAQTQERQEILDIIKRAEEPISAKAIADILEKNVNTTRNLIGKMVQENFLRREGRQGYVAEGGQG